MYLNTGSRKGRKDDDAKAAKEYKRTNTLRSSVTCHLTILSTTPHILPKRTYHLENKKGCDDAVEEIEEVDGAG
jgi:hypothetical protein